MRFYTKLHKHYCGIDLHAKKMFLCILDTEGNVLLHRNIASSPEAFLKTVAPFRDDLVVGDHRVVRPRRTLRSDRQRADHRLRTLLDHIRGMQVRAAMSALVTDPKSASVVAQFAQSPAASQDFAAASFSVSMPMGPRPNCATLIFLMI